MIRFVPTTTRKVSPDGNRVTIYVSGRVYELPQAELDRLFPMGGYELVRDTKVVGPTESKAEGGIIDHTGSDLGDTATGSGTVPPSADAPRSNRASKWLARKGGK